MGWWVRVCLIIWFTRYPKRLPQTGVYIYINDVCIYLPYPSDNSRFIPFLPSLASRGANCQAVGVPVPARQPEETCAAHEGQNRWRLLAITISNICLEILPSTLTHGGILWGIDCTIMFLDARNQRWCRAQLLLHNCCCNKLTLLTPHQKQNKHILPRSCSCQDGCFQK